MPRRMQHVALIYDARTAFDVKVMTGVAAYLQMNPGWTVYIEENALKDQRLPDLRSWRGDGIIANFDDPKVASAVMGSRLPTVAYGSDYGWFKSSPKIPYIVTNNEVIARMGAGYLRDRGFVRFAYCGYPRTAATVWAVEREVAFVKAVESWGYPCWTHRGLHRTAYNYLALQASLAEWLATLPKPIGLLAANDARARQVLDACRSAGVEVPREVAVLGVDNDEMVCQLSSPLLSSIEQGARQIGYEAAVLLDSIMSGRKLRRGCFAIGPVGVVPRLSTSTTAIEDSRVAKALAFISGRLGDGVKADDVVRATGLPRYWLDAAFKSTFGRSTYSQILHLRLEQARRLISTTNLPLKEVAASCGFRSVQHMSVLFRGAFGQPPATFRRTAASSQVPLLQS
ncbi:MAG: DNA-binding transcriptional regulator [Acidobacteria bacterium]|nr:DNA-binding transcriptional regulator [Acidobacteriota bacterium]